MIDYWGSKMLSVEAMSHIDGRSAAFRVHTRTSWPLRNPISAVDHMRLHNSDVEFIDDLQSEVTLDLPHPICRRNR